MRATSAAAAATLAGIGGLHVAWARGSSWPFPDRERLAAAVAGVESGDFAPPGVTYVVSGLLPAGDVAPFARLNRGLYSPLCLALGVAVGSTGLKQRFDG